MAGSYNVYRGSGGAPRRVAEEPPAGRGPARERAPSPLPGLGGAFAEPVKQGLEQLLGRLTGELETEDLILMLMLYLMYRESGDTEMLIIMGAMLFM